MNHRLTPDQIRTGEMLTDKGRQLEAALQAVAALESEYMQRLRDDYGLGPEWVIADWQTGFVRQEAEQNG